MSEAMEDREWRSHKEEVSTSFRAMSPVSVLGGPIDGGGQEEGGYHLQLPRWSDQWLKSVDNALAGWSSWEIPAPHGFWHAPHLAPQDLRAGYQGTAAYLLSIFACFPHSARAGRDLADHLYSFWQWDDWLKRYATSGETAKFARFLRDAGKASNLFLGGGGGAYLSGCASVKNAQQGWGQRPVRIGEEGREALRNFPTRLDGKYPCKKEEFLSVLTELAAENGAETSESSPVEGRRLHRYMSGWLLYAEQGLERHRDIRDACREGVPVECEDFLLYRALSSPLWLLFGAASVGSDQQALTEDVLTLLAQAAMLTALHSDLLLSSRNKGGSSASISALLLFSPSATLQLHSALRVALARTRSGLDAAANSSMAAGGGGLRGAVETVEACTYGLIRWYDFARKHEPSVAVDKPRFFFTSGNSEEGEGEESLSSSTDCGWDAAAVVSKATARIVKLAAKTFDLP